MSAATDAPPRPPGDPAHEVLLRQLQGQRNLLRESATRYQLWFYASLIVGWLGPLAFYAWLVRRPWYSPPRDLPLLGALVVGAILIVSYLRAQLAGRLADVQDIEFEIDLQQFEVLSRERRAEKLVRIHNLQLRRYYDLILNQNIWVFVVGITCILAGAAVIGAAFYLVLYVATDWRGQLITAALGAVSAILVNYVAAIFLRMHAGASANLGSFHSRLVDTNQVLMGNLLASRIENDPKRWETLARLAIFVAGRHGESGPPPRYDSEPS
jgi:hypothetical protein